MTRERTTTAQGEEARASYILIRPKTLGDHGAGMGALKKSRRKNTNDEGGGKKPSTTQKSHCRQNQKTKRNKWHRVIGDGRDGESTTGTDASMTFAVARSNTAGPLKRKKEDMMGNAGQRMGTSRSKAVEREEEVCNFLLGG